MAKGKMNTKMTLKDSARALKKTRRAALLRNITKTILETVVEIADRLISIPISRSDVFSIMNNYDRNWTNNDTNRWIANLKHRGYLDVKKSNGQESIILTDKAKMKVVEKLALKSDRDGKYRFVSFDIPEDMRPKRDSFRRAIKQMGFVQIQKSLWVIDRNVTDLVELAAYECGVEKYIAYIISEKSDIDGIIKRRLEKRLSTLKQEICEIDI